KAAPLAPEQKVLLDAIPNAKAFSFSAKLEGERVQLGAGMACANESAAKNLSSGLQTALEKSTKGVAAALQLKLMMAAVPAPARPAVQELIDTIRFDSAGPVARATMQIGVQQIKQLMQAGAAAAPPAMPPPGKMPGTRPMRPGGRP